MIVIYVICASWTVSVKGSNWDHASFKVNRHLPLAAWGASAALQSQDSYWKISEEERRPNYVFVQLLNCNFFSVVEVPSLGNEIKREFQVLRCDVWDFSSVESRMTLPWSHIWYLWQCSWSCQFQQCALYTSFDFPPHTHAAMSLILAHSSSMVIFTAWAIEKIEPGPPQDRNTISCSLKTFLHAQGFGCPRPVAQDQAVHAGQGFQQLSPLLPCGGGGTSRSRTAFQ